MYSRAASIEIADLYKSFGDNEVFDMVAYQQTLEEIKAAGIEASQTKGATARVAGCGSENANVPG